MNNLLIQKPSEANFFSYTATRKYYRSPGGVLTHTPSSNKFATGLGKISSFLSKNKLKAGLAGVGLAGTGMLASKALSTPKSLESRLKKTLKKNPQLSQAASIANKMFR